MAEKKQVSRPRKKRMRIILLSIVALLVIFRLVLPSIVLHYANRALASMPGYFGHVEDIDIALIRGAYQLNNIYVNKVDSLSQLQTSFFRSDMVDLSVEWKALFHGSLVGELIFQRPMLRFTKEKTEIDQVKQDTTDFRMLLDKFMPLQINRFEIRHGVLAYNDSTSKPVVTLEMTETNVLAENLKSVYETAEVLPAKVKADAYLYEGHLNFNLRLNPLADFPTFDLNSELKNTNLVKLNEFFKAYGKFDVNEGRFGLYSEMAAKDGKFKGYVKPIINDLDVVGPEDRTDGFLHKLWERFVGAVGVVFRNQRKDQIATKVPLEGSFTNPNPGIVDAVAEIIVNAFIQALVPAIDNEITLRSLAAQPDEKKGLLQKIFGRKEDKEKGK